MKRSKHKIFKRQIDLIRHAVRGVVERHKKIEDQAHSAYKGQYY